MTPEREFCLGECCKNPFNLCSHQHACGHHVNTDNDHRARRTHPDPTGDAAIWNLECAEREQKKRRP